MTRSENMSSRDRVIPAVIVAVSVLAYTVAAQLFISGLNFVMALLQGQGLQFQTFGMFAAPTYLFTALALCVGIYAWLWLVTPVTAGLRLGDVVMRSLFSVLAGAVVAFVVIFGFQMQAWLANANFFSNSLGQASESFVRDGGNAFTIAVGSAIQLSVNALPVTVLAVVLTWIWVVRHSAHRVVAPAQVEV